MRRKANSILTGILLILVLIAAPAGSILMPDRDFSPAENRILQELPDFNVYEYLDGRLERDLEDYVNDQFVFRDEFIRVKTAADRTAGVLENNGVYLAKDQYLIEDLAVPDETQLTACEEALRYFRESYPDLPMYFLLAPNAGNILEDKLPATVELADQNRYMDEFFEYLTAADFWVIDVREAFRQQKDDVQLYYRTDHHWTTNGAYLAYQQAIRDMTGEEPLEFEPFVVQNNFRGTLYSKSGFTNGMSDEIRIYLPADRANYLDSVIYYSDSQTKTTEFYQVDNLEDKDAYTVFGGSNHPMYTIKTPVESEERLLIVKDSYANSMIPFLTQYYREIVVVDPRYYFENLDDLIAVEGVTQVLFLYNANTFFTDDSLAGMLVEGEAGE
ncbi:MAG: hypothetical protein IJH77_00875 [Mogibacterium sp.]|nr:hypothetical protein [Mogibacterium sp.]